MNPKDDNEYEWFDPGHLRFILKALKKYCIAVLEISTYDNEIYRLNYNKDEKIWIVTHIMRHGDIFYETKRNLSKYVNRICNVKEIVIRRGGCSPTPLDR